MKSEIEYLKKKIALLELEKKIIESYKRTKDIDKLSNYLKKINLIKKINNYAFDNYRNYPDGFLLGINAAVDFIFNENFK